jgi:hypothetical protein
MAGDLGRVLLTYESVKPVRFMHASIILGFG